MRRNRVRPSSAGEGRLLAALGLISAAATAQQIALMQVLGWMHWHHFAYMIVAVALLGFGVAGTVLTLARDRLVEHWRAMVPSLLLFAALSMPAGVRLAQTAPLAVDLPLLFFAPSEVWRLVLLCVLLLPPFFCAGLITGVVLTVHARDAGRIYAASLAGAGAGGLIGLALVATLSPPRLAAAVAVLAMAGAGGLWRQLTGGARMATLVVAALTFLQLQWPGELRPSQFKSLSRALELPGAQVVADRPGIHGWVQVVSASALRPAPAVSLQFQGTIPAQPAVFINGLSYGSLLDATAISNPAWLDFTTDAVAFAATRPKHVLLLENGPGGWASLAHFHGARRIAVVEPNRALVDLLTQSEPPLAPEWRLSGVTLLVADGRAALRRGQDDFDLIRFPTVGALGGTSGLTSASEQFLLTRDAFVDAWRRLAAGGVIAVTAWMDFPERNPLRLIATLAEALEQSGVPPRAHLIAVRGWATITLLARRPLTTGAPAWSPTELATLRQFCRDRGFDPLLLPDLKPDEREANHLWQNAGFFSIVDTLVDGPRRNVYQNHEFMLEPASDTRPYFSQFLRWSGWTRITEAFGTRAFPFFELGSWVVALTFLVLLIMASAGIALPLVRRGWRTPGKTRVLLYFGGLGAGYMLAEIGLMLRAHALLGSPVLAASLVMTSLLLASGVGSLWSDRLSPSTRIQRFTVATIVIGLVSASALLAWLTPVARTWPAVGGLVLLIAIVACLGAALGAAFPLGLRWLESTAPAHIPWAWAVNGCISVATPAGAMLLAMQFGFGMLFATAAAAYGLALFGTLFSAGSTTRSTTVRD